MEYKEQTTPEFLTEIQEKYGCMDSYVNGGIIGYIIGELINQQIVAKERQEEQKIDFEKFLEIENILNKQIKDIMAVEERESKGV